jgi:hypothetical protein
MVSAEDAPVCRSLPEITKTAAITRTLEEFIARRKQKRLLDKKRALKQAPK